MKDSFILLVEDNPDDEALTMRALKNHILNEIIVTHDGVEALEWLFGGHDDERVPPELVLPDLHLPPADGLEVLRRMRADERTRFVPVVVLTGSKEQEDIFASYRCGANAYVRKPVEFADFAEAVQALGVFWLLLNKRPPDFVSPPN